MEWSSSAGERAAVQRFLQAVIVSAHHMAARTATYLKSHGIRPRKGRGSETPADPQSAEQARQFLLNLGAALRLAEWEQAGLLANLTSETLPTPTEVLRRLVPMPSDDGDNQRMQHAPSLAADVFRIWCERFSHAARQGLGVDVLLPMENLREPDLLEAIADLLWAIHGIKRTDELHVEAGCG